MSHTGTARFIKSLLDSFKTNEDKIAVVDQNGQRQTTYKELHILACRVAAYLRQQDYPAHSFIGICLPTSLEYIASEIGIWLAGHAIVPMGHQYPKSRIDYIMQHCEAPLLIDDEVFRSIAQTEPSTTELLPGEKDVCALFYTSGSTGTPKGVLDSFASFRIPPCLAVVIEQENISVMGITSPMYFVACKLLYAILLQGGTADLVPSDIIRDIRQFETYLDKHQIEFVFIPPSVLPSFHNKSSRLKVVIAASERLSGIAPKQYKLYNHYGQTETGGAIFTFFVDKVYENTPIGIPESDIEYCVLDEEGKTVEQGEEGELCVRGEFTLGYYKDPELTEKLYSDGWLHTGDIVRQLPDGNVLYVNRKDWMVKINGQRVEPGEVENAMMEMDGIEKAIVKGFEANNHHSYLCAYYIASEAITDEAIRQYLSTRLPDYMIPSYFVRMDHVPLLPNGKTDRKSLLSPIDTVLLSKHQPSKSPTTEVERMLCQAFEQTLHVGQVGIDDDFFLLGGDSISVMQVQTLCPSLSIPAPMIYKLRSPRRIAEACGAVETTDYEKWSDYCLSQTQLGIFVECMSRQGEVAYNNGMLFRLSSAVDTERLAQACEAVVNAHPYIKTRLFVDDEGNPRQRRNDDYAYQQTVESISCDAFRSLKPQLIQPFDLLNDQLFRIRIFKTPEEAFLFIDFHHIIFDGLSYEILLTDLRAAYDGVQIERETFSGFDVALEEEKALRMTEAYADAKQWFVEQFENLKLSSLPMPDKHEPAISYGQERLELSVSYDRLQEASECLGVTPNVLTTTVFGYLLGVYTHAQESLFATVFSGRQDMKTVRTVAMLVKTLPVYTTWDDATTVRELLQATKQQLMGSMSNSLFSFAEMKSVNSAINSHILFVYQGELKTADDDLFTQQPLMENATGEMMAFEVLCQHGQLSLHAEYQSNLYSQAFIRRLMQCYGLILEGFVNARYEDKPLRALPVLTPDEQQAILALGTGEPLDLDASETIVDLFRRQVTLRPDAIAVVDEVSEITYRELDRRSDILALTFREAGVGADSFVAIMLPRRKEFLVAVLAVFKAGAAYIPLDSDYPQERLAYMLNDSGARLLVTSSSLSHDRQTAQYYPLEKQLFIDDVDFSKQPTRPVNDCQPSGLAFMIYTSGTTGAPKGVMIGHVSLRVYLENHVRFFHLTSEDRCAQHASFSFDASLEDLLPPLTVGAQIHILSSELRLNLSGMNDYFKQRGITGITMSTQIGIEMLNNFRLPVRYLMLGGSKMRRVPIGTTIVVNGYGPTEFTVCSSCYIMEQDDPHDDIPIGRPIPDSMSVIVDAACRLVPRGTVGELCLIGRQMSRGYWKREELTAQRFVDCSFLPGQKMYRTGDLARWNEEGLLEYIGRIDNQVKLHGYRIELEEIENQMSQCPGVVSAAAVFHKQDDIEYIIGYYTSEDHQTLPDIQERLAAALPSYMVPSRIVRIDEMPLTPNGKIDRKALLVLEANSEAEVGVQPKTAMEKSVFDIVSDQLKASQFGVTDNLLFYGLSSLAAMRLAVVLEKRLHGRITMADIINQPTVRAIAAKLESSGNANSLHAFAPQTYYPLTESQRGLYLEWEKNRHTTQYNMPIVYRFNHVDADRMVRALRQTVDAHPFMKTRLVVKDGDVMFERHDDDTVKIAMTAVNAEPPISMFQQRVRPFRLLGKPLFRIEVVAAPEHVFVFFDAHHIIFDGLSSNVFINDLKRAYDGETLEREEFQAYDYALYEQAMLSDEEKMQEAEAWYDKLLADANEISNSNFNTPDGTKCAEVEVSFPSREIDAFCASIGVTVNSYMHAAFSIVVRRLIKEESPLYLTISNGRNLGTVLQRCVGMFVKTMPVVVASDKAAMQANTDYVKEVHQRLQESYSMDHYPYTKIVERHHMKSDLMFLFQGGLNDDCLWEDMSQIPLSLDTAKFPLSIVVTPEGDSYRVTLEYDGRRFNRQGILQMAKALRNVFLGLTSTSRVSDIKLVSPEEQSELLRLSRGETLDYDQSETFVDLFQRQVSQTPDAIAVVDSLGHLTYRELDNQSNIVARMLVDRGVGKDVFVGVMLPRTKEFLVAVLGIFKAGGAYIPLDHEYPEARLSYMLNDSQAHLLISTRQLVGGKGLEKSIGQTVLLFLDDIDLSGASVAVNHSQSTSLAYMIYTSGSTGRPKGVMMEHKGLCALMKWLVPMEGLRPGDKCAEHASFSFDASLFDLFPPLTCGAEVHILSSELRQDMNGMCAYFTQHNITGMTMSTQLGMELVNSQELPLRYMVMGGEKMNQLRKTSVRLINGYGPTEFTVCSSYHIVDQEKDSDIIPIGRPVPNSMSVIVDSMGHLVPKGIPGELCLIGRQMSRGYWRQDEQTARHFTDCPFLDGEKMYHTGDLARWNEAGELVYLGRTDNQVKFNGFRIELGEIENKMNAYPSVTAAAALVVNRKNAQTLTGYYCADKAVAPQAMLHHLRASLPHFMVPQVVIQIDRMPMTPNGKIDQKVLRATAFLDRVTISNHTEPANQEEEVLYDIVKTILERDDFGVTDNLFNLGMTSLMAIKLATLAAEQGVLLKVNDILKYETIREMAAIDQNVITWDPECHSDKPIVVLIQGFTTYHQLVPLVNALHDTYSVCIVEPLEEHVKQLFQKEDYSQILYFYTELLDASIPAGSQIHAFIGHSFGGELAYQCCIRWHELTGQRPKVFLFDSYCHLSALDTGKLSDAPVEATTDEEQAIIQQTIHYLQVYNAVSEGLSFLPYDGDVVLFKADEYDQTMRNLTKADVLTEYETMVDENERHWRALIPHIEIVPVKAGHFSMLGAEHVRTYMDYINRSLSL